MTVELNMVFFDTHKSREIHKDIGYVFANYFRDDGWRRAQEAASADQANRILNETYEGADVDGIGVRWKPVKYSENPMEHVYTIAITMAEAKRILDWRARMDPESEESWSEADSALMGKLLDFVDD